MEGRVRVKMKGLNRVKKPNGQVYYYAWKGGPRIEGEFGTPEFLASYQQACLTKSKAPTGTLLELMQAYQAAPEFTEKAVSTKEGYIIQIKKIEKKFGKMPLAALADR